ncbi:MAG: hypothetical protein E7067_05815 [Lentimicrobiaceae bacterium]|nr:hypothetical protein [Lentimicrobiaceae bacterium]
MNNIKVIILGSLFSLLLLSCTKNDDTTVILLGEEAYIEKITDVIPDTLQHVFEEYFGTNPSGYIPPNVEGEYIISPKQRIFSNVPEDNWPLDIIEPDINITMSKQHNRECILQLKEATETLTDTVYITGYDNLFTVYYTEEKTLQHSGYEHYITRNVIFKGEMTDYGIKNLKIASIIVNADDNSHGNMIQYKRGDFFLYEDGDNLSEKIN